MAAGGGIDVYMGAEAELATGPRGQICNRVLLEQRSPVAPQVIPISRRIWSIVGVSLAASHVIQGGGGLIVVDTGTSLEDGREVLRLLRTVSDLPVRAVIYTHSHYCEGTAALLEKGQTLEIWAHERCERNHAQIVSSLAPLKRHRIAAQAGLILPHDGPDADSAGSSVGRRGPTGYLPPTRVVAADAQMHAILGVPVRFFTRYPFDTDDTLLMELPEDGAVIHNHMSGNFPNIYSIGGGPYRDPLPWIEGLDLVRRLDPEVLLGVHGLPIVGREAVRQAVTATRDALQFVHDQTVRGMNLGLSPEELVFFVRLPEQLERHPHLAQTYGEVWHHVRSVACGLMGWFDGDAVNLGPVDPGLEARRIVEGFGGPQAAAASARRALAAREYAWAARLARWLERAGCGPEARPLLVEALRAMAQVTTAWSTRNFCLTQALELEGRAARPGLAGQPSPEAVLSSPPRAAAELLRFRLDPARCRGGSRTLALRFSDCRCELGVTVRNAVAEITEPAPAGADVKLELERRLWIEVVLGRRTLAEAAAADGVRAEPSLAEVEAFLEVFDRG